MHYLVLDLEMTGTDPGWHEIIQVGAVLYDENWKVLGRFLSNVYPENEESFSIPAERVHDLSWDELQDAPMQHEVLKDFEGWIRETLYIKSHDPDKWKKFRSIFICGQSVMYDVNFLKFAYREEKMKWPFSNTVIDLHNLSWFLFQVLEKNGVEVPRRRSLEAVARYFGYERESDSHNALEDSVLTGKCLQQVVGYIDKLTLSS